MFELHPQLANDTIEIGNLSLCKILLMNDSQYPWLTLVPMRAKITELHQLNSQDYRQYCTESQALSRAFMDKLNGDKMNIAALGNVVPQCHIHHIVRFKHDASWPKPIWGNKPVLPYTSSALNLVISRYQKIVNYVIVELSIK